MGVKMRSFFDQIFDQNFDQNFDDFFKNLKFAKFPAWGSSREKRVFTDETLVFTACRVFQIFPNFTKFANFAKLKFPP